MTKRYAILQKKLQELESELPKVFQLPAGTPIHQLLSDGIQQRFVFVKNLLAAEMASNPSKPHHLNHIAGRLTELDAAFSDWDNDNGNVGNDFDAKSICSCTESCLNDDGEGSPDLGSPVCDVPESFEEKVEEEEREVPESFYEAVRVGEERVKVVEERIKKVEERVTVVEEREVKRSVWVWRHCGAVMGSGMVLGAVLVGFLVPSFYAFFHYFEYEGVLTPT